MEKDKLFDIGTMVAAVLSKSALPLGRYIRSHPVQPEFDKNRLELCAASSYHLANTC